MFVSVNTIAVIMVTILTVASVSSMAATPTDYLPTSGIELEVRWFHASGEPMWGGCSEERSTFLFRVSNPGQVGWARQYVRYISPTLPGPLFFGESIELVSPIDNVLRSPTEQVFLRFTSVFDSIDYFEFSGSSNWGVLSMAVRGDTIIVDHTADIEFCEPYRFELYGITRREDDPDPVDFFADGVFYGFEIPDGEMYGADAISNSILRAEATGLIHDDPSQAEMELLLGPVLEADSQWTVSPYGTTGTSLMTTQLDMPWGIVEDVLPVDYDVSDTEQSDLFRFGYGSTEGWPAQVRFWFAPGLGIVKGEGRDSFGVITGAFEASAMRSVAGAPTVPSQAGMIKLLRANPNPFNPVTTISFDLAAESIATLNVYDMSGKLVKTLLKQTQAHAGRNQVQWDGRDEQGRLLASGVYLYRLVAGGFSETRRMVLLK